MPKIGKRENQKGKESGGCKIRGLHPSSTAVTTAAKNAQNELEAQFAQQNLPRYRPEDPTMTAAADEEDETGNRDL